MKSILLLFVFFISTIVTKAQGKFNWVTWDKVTAKVKTDLKSVKTDKKTTLFAAISQYRKDGVQNNEISVAVLDMDGDGKMEYAVSVQSADWCGSMGCSLEVYKDGGKKQIHLTDEIDAVKPAKNGVMSSQGKLIPYENVNL